MDLRRRWRLAAFAVVTAWFHLLRGILSVTVRPCSPSLDRRLRARGMRAWGRTLMRILHIRVHVRGTPPPHPALIVSNHLGYLDIPVLASVTGAVFVSRHDVADWPLLGPAVRAYDTIFVDRTNPRCLGTVNAAIHARHTSGDAVMFFPEGTSTDGCSGVHPFGPSLFEQAARDGTPVHTAAISYRTPADAPPPATHVCWWGDMDFLPHFADLLRIPRFDAMVAFGAEPVHAADRKALAQTAHDRVQQLLEELGPPRRADAPGAGKATTTE